MNNEVEEFLRRAAARRAQVEAQMRAQAEARARGQQMPPQQQPPQIPVAYSPQRPVPQQFPPQRQPPAMYQQPQSAASVQAQIVQVELAENQDRLGSGVASHLRGTDQISQHTAHLSDRVDVADDEMDARLHQTFDHQVGRLKQTTAVTPEASRGDSNATAAVVAKATVLGIAHMLQSPENIRSAIILNEVFNRPLDRW